VEEDREEIHPEAEAVEEALSQPDPEEAVSVPNAGTSRRIR